MKKEMNDAYIQILRQELIPALGCTEPIAIALAAAKARQVLGHFPESLEIHCSGSIIKNVKSVIIPNSGGLKGIEAAATLGMIGGDPNGDLEVLSKVTDQNRQQTQELLAANFTTCKLQENVDNLYVVAKVGFKEEFAEVTIINRHTLISKIVKNGKVLFQQPNHLPSSKDAGGDSSLSVETILEFANSVAIEDVKEVLDRQIKLNSEIAACGLEHDYGTQVGKTLLQNYGANTPTRAKAVTAAASDARMGGCPKPVVINSGSGNQGLTVSLPVIEYARSLKVGQDKLYRALCVSNLISIHLKRNIGSLSAFCGAVTAASGSGAAITYLHGGSYQQISNTITNTIANIGGIVCDGAKPSCAAKVASSVDAAILAHHMSMKGHTFLYGEGLVQNDIESTIKSIGYVGRVGMKNTDLEILHIMTNQISFC
ncbi:L-serine ammonia-lyase, iron-sulfur-dependent, subunit alpha [Gottschalkiaceae bacterium SANA]|nr:L-serine ammonia-lyase, iron-sulfur-dependent, subunit alpha [Gottschalkiaceae bacterium SANA]